MFLTDICKELFGEISKLTTFPEVFLCLYLAIRFAANKNEFLANSARYFVCNALLTSLCVALALVVLVIVVFILIVPFLLYKLLIILVLRVRYGKNYAGLLNCADAIWLVEDDKSRNIVNFLFLVQFDKGKRNLTEYVGKICSGKFLRSTLRLTCVRKKFMGYVCLVGNQLTVDDVVRDLEMPSDGSLHDAKTLQKIVQNHSNNPLPKNDTATWELLVGQRPIRLEGHEEDQYPLLMRVHHSAGDGVTFLSILLRYISDEGASVLPETKSIQKRVRIWERLKDYWSARAYLIPLIHPTDDNLLHGPVLSGEKNVGFYIEDKPKYLQIVKKLKRRLPGATFSAVIFTAISASLDEYFGRHSNSSPNKLTLAFIAVANRNDLVYLHDKLSNIFSIGCINLPVNLRKDGGSLIERFSKTQEECRKFARSYDIWINHLQLQTFANVLPAPILKQILKLNDVNTVAFSNLPGFKKIHISGQALNHMLFWIPNYLSTGVGFSIMTYDDRFHMGLMIDKVLVPDEDEVQRMLNNVFKYIDLLNEEFDAKDKEENS